MPIPFEHFPMNDLQQWPKEQFRQEAKNQGHPDKLGDLAHFLVQNYRDELQPGEHVVDAAIRLLKK